MDSSDNRNALLRQLGEQVEALRSSEGWLRWLETASKFRETYSLRNQLLIQAVRPTATRVAGYRVWQSVGRRVKRGERGIPILAPTFRKLETDDGEVERYLAGFRVVHVFDIAQTEGDNLPELNMAEVVVPDRALYSRLAHAATSQGFEVITIESATNGARGWYEPDKRRITIVETYPLASRVRTLLHELSHAHDTFEAEDTRDERELVAESAAFLVGTDLRIDLSDASTFYLATWGADAQRLEALAERVLQVAEHVGNAIAPIATTPNEESAT